MSSIYQTEPPTSGKVILHTSFGDVDIELWCKEAPIACRNFIQLSMEKYYDNVLIHRVIKDFMMQTGDPTGTGSGGESIYNNNNNNSNSNNDSNNKEKIKGFKDEIHGRIKFNKRGLVAMANDNIPNTNRSQFFITFAPCEWLNKKHTIFGKVTGNTIFNVMSVNEMDTTDTDMMKDKPVNDIYIKSVEILNNPFDDIVARINSNNNNSSSNNSVENEAAAELAKRKKERKASNNKTLLSFGDDDDDHGSSGSNGSSSSSSVRKFKTHTSLHDSKLKSKPSVLSSIKNKNSSISSGSSSSSSNSTTTTTTNVNDKLKNQFTATTNNNAATTTGSANSANINAAVAVAVTMSERDKEKEKEKKKREREEATLARLNLFKKKIRTNS